MPHNYLTTPPSSASPASPYPTPAMLPPPIYLMDAESFAVQEYTKHIGNGYNLLQENYYKEAIPHFSKALEYVDTAGRNPFYALYNRGFTHHNLGQWTHAINDLTLCQDYPCSTEDIHEAQKYLARAYCKRAAVYRSQTPPALDQNIADLEAAERLLTGDNKKKIQQYIAQTYSDYGTHQLIHNDTASAKSSFQSAMNFSYHPKYEYQLADAELQANEPHFALPRTNKVCTQYPGSEQFMPERLRQAVDEPPLIRKLEMNQYGNWDVLHQLVIRHNTNPKDSIASIPISSHLAKAYYVHACHDMKSSATINQAFNFLKNAAALKTPSAQNPIEPSQYDLTYMTAVAQIYNGDYHTQAGGAAEAKECYKKAQFHLHSLTMSLPESATIYRQDVNSTLATVLNRLKPHVTHATTAPSRSR